MIGCDITLWRNYVLYLKVKVVNLFEFFICTLRSWISSISPSHFSANKMLQGGNCRISWEEIFLLAKILRTVDIALRNCNSVWLAPDPCISRGWKNIVSPVKIVLLMKKLILFRLFIHAIYCYPFPQWNPLWDGHRNLLHRSIIYLRRSMKDRLINL